MIIDVRTPEQYRAGHIHDAVNISLAATNFREEVRKLDRNRPYYLYCNKGITSASAAKVMREEGFYKVFELDKGLDAWKQEGLLTDTGTVSRVK